MSWVVAKMVRRKQSCEDEMKILERENSNPRNIMVFLRKCKITEWMQHSDPGRERPEARSKKYEELWSCIQCWYLWGFIQAWVNNFPSVLNLSKQQEKIMKVIFGLCLIYLRWHRPNGRSKEELKSLLLTVKEESEKSSLRTQHWKKEDLGIWSHHLMENVWRENGNSDRLCFLERQNHCRWRLQPWI